MPEEPYLTESEGDYHARTGVEMTTSGSLRLSLRSLFLYYCTYVIPFLEKKKTPAMELGSAFHLRALFGEEVYHDTYAIGGPINEKTGKAYGEGTKKFEEWATDQGKGSTLSTSTDKKLWEMVDALSNHKEAVDILANREEGLMEKIIRTDYEGLPCQIKFDLFYPDRELLVDLKTTSNLESFEKAAYPDGYNYLSQMAFYRQVISLTTQINPECVFVVVESTAPYRVGVWNIDSFTLNQSRIANERGLRQLRESIKQERTISEDWPSGYEEIRTLSIV
jgi:exodeoxyribonuclease VIII